jgi:hypothetical protein
MKRGPLSYSISIWPGPDSKQSSVIDTIDVYWTFYLHRTDRFSEQYWIKLEKMVIFLKSLRTITFAEHMT